MKKHHLILGFTALYSSLFYQEGVGVNLSLFALAIIFVVYFQSVRKTFVLHALTIMSVFAAFAYSWYGDGASFFALFFSVVFLIFQNQEKKLHLIQAVPIVVINLFSSFVRPFVLKNWFPSFKLGNDGAKKIIAYLLIPSLFLVVFFVIYSFGSDTFSNLFFLEFDLDFPEMFWVLLFGFYFSFNLFGSFVPEYCYDLDPFLNNDFSEKKKELQPSFSILDLDFERKSGEISLIVLNLLLLLFIVSYNYEQFFKIVSATTLSAGTHERVNAVVLSIIMAVGVLLFYFKDSFNFDPQAVLLKRLASLWVGLNAILVLSTAIKNAEYILHFGLTYKRLGVFAFLLIILIGLVFTFFKIKFKKTNAYLFNQMIWVLYGLLLTCSFINWGAIITNYNISTNKGVDPAFLSGLNFNDESRRSYFEDNKIKNSIEVIDCEQNIKSNKAHSFLSKALYYEFLE